MGSPPFMYSAEQRSDARFPVSTFDPKAVTRASWEPSPRRAAQNRPLISFNKHPDHYLSLGRGTKRWIQWLRGVQLFIRSLEFNGELGILVLLVLITNIDDATGWIMRILSGVAMIHCLYAVYHLSRKASGRTPGSSAAYHVFAAIFDLAVMSLYAFGAVSTHNGASEWTTRVNDQNLMRYFVPALYYMTIATGGLHLISLSISLWLGMKFRKISLMPPDMNPLEDHLTARPLHKRNKSSIATGSSSFDEKQYSGHSGSQGRFGSALGNDSHPPIVPFLQTRTGSSHSGESRASLMNLPSRQYQIISGHSPQSSFSSASDKRTLEATPSRLGAYSAVSATESQSPQQMLPSNYANRARPGKFTESWMPTDSLMSRTNQRHQTMTTAAASFRQGNYNNKSYAALNQTTNDNDPSDNSEYDDENGIAYDKPTSIHPNPLGSHPSVPDCTVKDVNLLKAGASNANTELHSLSEMSGNPKRVSNSRDIADQSHVVHNPWKRQRDSSIQLDDDFYCKSYGDLRSATPPIMIGSGRKVSSGIDYGMGYRRNISGKIAEEGRSFR
ncbi:hypothetical protein QQS21_001158 [Conoideocrella luteorostrata]|uniref:Uncharacterized protein n=1 Tax=Conoideocrella luteorostrata TaxID=1105319 RepID=A0AAJ0D0H0_9HYPO|nr:hypothetical protein QQS21_001158 [Conoideocrella luteorostrata]